MPIPPEYRQPVGKYATSFASAAGIQIRKHLPDVGVRRWSKVPATTVEPIIQRLNVIAVSFYSFIYFVKYNLLIIVVLIYLFIFFVKYN